MFVRFFFGGGGGGVEVTDFSRDFSASDLVGLRISMFRSDC